MSELNNNPGTLNGTETFNDNDKTINDILNELISTFGESELNILHHLLRNKMYFALLYKEAEWLSTHHYGRSTEDDDDGDSAYSGDTEADHRCQLINLVLGLFGHNCDTEVSNYYNDIPDETEISQRKTLLKVLRNMTHLKLLKKEADWLSTHSFDQENDEGKTVYNPETEGVHKIHLQNLVLGIFDLKFHPKTYAYKEHLHY
jgi:hypothetical protein